MTERERMQEGMDLRLFLLLFIRKIWIIAAGGLAGTLLLGGGYFVRHVVYAPARQYEALSRYYITFADDMGKDYYNDYTWNDLAASDPILDYTMSLLPEGYEKDVVRESVEAKIYSDVRVLTTMVTTEDPDRTLEIALATERSICHFGEIMPEIAGIEVILDAEVKPVIADLYMARAALLGLTGGLTAALFYVLFRMILEDSVFIDREAARRFAVPVLGSFFRGELDAAQAFTADTEDQPERELPTHLRMLRQNLDYLAPGVQKVVPLTGKERQAAEAAARRMYRREGRIEAAESCLERPEVCTQLRAADGVILLAQCGAHNGSLLAGTIELLAQQGCKVSGLVLYNADRTLWKQYYFGRIKERKDEK